MHLSLLFKPNNTLAIQGARELFYLAGTMGITLHISKRLDNELPDRSQNAAVHVHESDLHAIKKGEITVAIGGDGTILKTAHIARTAQRPLLGINSGRLGFLATIQLQHMQTALHDVIAGNFDLDQRSLIEAEFSNGDTQYALNEFVFSRKGSVSMITLTAEYDGAFINRYWADGIIVSTPTGSTAYNLSTGGPIVVPQTDVFVLTPISPHSLTTRPLILSSKKNLAIKVEPDDQEVLFSGDGIIYDLPQSSPSVTIRRSDNYIQLIQIRGQSYFETLRTKLMWGRDIRDRH